MTRKKVWVQCKHNFVLNVFQSQLAGPAEAEAMSSWPTLCCAAVVNGRVW